MPITQKAALLMWKTLNFQQSESSEITCLSVATTHGKMGSTEQFQIQIYLFI